MSGALEDIVVLDLTAAFWSSLGVALLADFGAQAIKIERLPDARASRSREGESDDAPWNYLFELANRNKLSLAVSLDEPRGRQIFEALVRRTDVVFTDGQPAELETQQLDYASLAALKPDLVYARGTGLGPRGPDRELPALDELAAARTGLMPVLGQPGQPPVYTGAGQMYSTVMLAFGVMAALRHRGRTGQGQEVDVSLFAGNMYGASLDLQAFLAIGGERFLQPVSRMDAGNPMSGTLYPTEDGRWVTLTMPDTDRWWPALAEVTGLDQHDPRFDSHDKRCEANRLQLIELLDEAFRRKSAGHWRAVFNERQMSADVIEDYAYPASDELARQNRYVMELEHPSLGPLKTLGFPVFMSDAPARLRRTAPCLGQHSAEVLAELLGMAEDDIVELQTAGVIV